MGISFQEKEELSYLLRHFAENLKAAGKSPKEIVEAVMEVTRAAEDYALFVALEQE